MRRPKATRSKTSSNRLFHVLDLHWRSPESGGVWCKSGQLTKKICLSLSEGWWLGGQELEYETTEGDEVEDLFRLLRHIKVHTPIYIYMYIYTYMYAILYIHMYIHIISYI